jgi:hypothetical protein
MAANNPFGVFQPRPIGTLGTGPQSTHNFQPLRENEGNGRINFHQTISSAPQHEGFSFEELRLNDNAHGRGVVTRPPADLTSFANTLSLATVRQRFNLFSKPVFARRTLEAYGLHLGSKMVVFNVGKDEPKEFAIHENLIAPVSEFVRLALTKDWKEAATRTIPLPDDSPEVFELLQNWLYTKHIPSMNPSDGVKDSAEYSVLVHAYILGDKFGITNFKDAILDSIILKLSFTGRFDPRLAGIVYDNTMDRSPLRRLWQDIYVWAGNPTWLDEGQLGEFIHAVFTLDLSRYQMQMMRGQGPVRPPYEDAHLGGCWYHEHGMEECYRVKLG